ncbi:sigmaK-factor processing regulatory BofA [Alicyclobacillus contaminans]|uniref:pro-sigmaK processing inhibitor BofA family protein n=1 Tax=Alicyclobacillus contaminans TaxID=392016 RepID=UPI000421F61C|nr:pro-sigmaK processing inhibitor BofA family protein [Alicyclobacillus contaminans]GMA50570.1 sigmaK-factor processing regulatory BofA [Alicyclobacillus contaminans]
MSEQHLLIGIGLFLIGVYAVAQVVRYPRQMAWKLVKSAVLGCLFVLAVNWIGGYFHFHLPFNPVTALTAGFLGIPGVAALIVMKLWLVSG